ncbi:MAG: serine/threonine-protein kinase [Saccharofermentans sp.]|nr:serine/threonine-protein kinase [Saccharofermentans sp.]
MKYCYSCFQQVDENINVCPHCGKPIINKPKEPIYLIPGTILNNRYVVGEAIGAGGFGVIYKAFDTKLEVVVGVKEFYASRLVTRAAGEKQVIISKKSKDEFDYRKDRFLAEARTMAQFGKHRNIVNVFEFFEENNTAYIVMELLSGMALNDYLKQHGKLDSNLSLMIVNEVGSALRSLHSKGIIHRDIAPDNIFICEGSDLKIKLLDLGSAKLPDSSEAVIDIILKPGYSPCEQYDTTKTVSTWSDIYALGATLYVMLTGVKPDESTNRKIKDIVVAPKELDSSISENLSNSVMRAMAIEYHMRFKTVDEFLKAINGEKKVISLAAEKRRRNAIRLVEICAVVLALAITGMFVYKRYDDKKAAQILRAADIEVWFSVADGSNEELAMQAIIEDFTTTFPDVTVEYRAIPEDEYASVLEEAALSGELPDLFESSDVSQTVLDSARDCSLVLNSEQAEECQFLNGYSDTGRVPLGISVPIAYIVTNGPTSIDYQGDSFNDLESFSGYNIAVGSNYIELIERNFGQFNWSDSSEFLTNDNSVAVMLSSSMDLDTVKTALTGVMKTCVAPGGDEVFCDYVYYYSLGFGNDDEQAAADRFLSWMLGNVYQNALMVSYCNDGQLPINNTCFQDKIANSDLACLINVYQNFVFDTNSQHDDLELVINIPAVITRWR